jgi:hypothetical protein
MTEPTPRDEILTGRNEATPARALGRVVLVVAVAVLVIGGLVYGLFAAFGGKQHGSTAPAISARR